MKWVTRDHLHLDRVAAPWLIRRWIDADAEFVFVPTGSDAPLPPDAIPFGLPGVQLSAHDADGSTCRKIVRRYAIEDAALEMVCDIVEDGIAWFLAGWHGKPRNAADLRYPEAIGLEALSQGMMFISADDMANLESSMLIYDALYARCRAELLFAEAPDLRNAGPVEKVAAVKAWLETGVRP